MRQTSLILALAAAAAALALTSCKKAEPPVRTYAMGEKIALGRLTYTAFETQWAMQLGEAPSQRIPQHRFFLVRMSVVNSGSESVIVPSFTVEDDSGRSYAELNNGDGVPQWIKYLRRLSPADSLQGNVLFDAPPAHYRLKLASDDESQAAYIDIPLSFGAETPEIPLPADKKN